MPVEKGIRLGTTSLADLRKSDWLGPALRDFSWFYIGPEFCENLITESVCEEAAELQAQGKRVCLLSPMLGERGIGRLDSVFRKLMILARRGRLDPSRLEITLNDFGTLELARRNRLPCRLSAGRLLYGNFFGFDEVDNRMHVHDSPLLEFFKGIGVSRCELSTTGSGHRTNLCGANLSGFDPGRFKVTLYYPYLNLTSTRTCLVGMPPIPPGRSPGTTGCSQECRIGSFEMDHPWINEKLVVRGNTVFLDFPDRFYESENDLLKLGVDRLVYCPFP